MFVATSHDAPLLTDVSITHVVPNGVRDTQRAIEPVTGVPGSVSASLTQEPESGLKAVDTDETVLIFPVGRVTAVEVENVAPVTAVVVVMLPAVAETSAAEGIPRPCVHTRALFSAPYGTDMLPVLVAELNALAQSIMDGWHPKGVYVTPDPSVATRLVQPGGAPRVQAVAFAAVVAVDCVMKKPAPTGTEKPEVVVAVPPVDDAAGRPTAGAALVMVAPGATPRTVNKAHPGNVYLEGETY